MSFFKKLLAKNNLSSHDGRPLWKYFLTGQDFNDLCKTFRYVESYDIDARDAAIFYAEWWKRNYKGGIPSKESIFDSLEGNVKFYFNHNEFYNLAIKGGQMLGLKWIIKQNTLRFKTLLLQGGLPLTHIGDNKGRYLNFLLAVLEEQPDSIEDFIFQPHIIHHLPISSQNDIVYENCFEIVKSILNEENIYDELLGSDDALKEITGELKVRALKIERKTRLSKPKNYWILKRTDDKCEISLRIGLAKSYSNEALKSILGIEISEDKYQLFLNDKLICVFRKMQSGAYKTDWFNQEDHNWDGDDNLPIAYIIFKDIKTEVNGFIQTSPTLLEPTLWSKYSENEWRLIKGNGSVDKNPAVLMPLDWKSENPAQFLYVLETNMHWLEFEGELKVLNHEELRTYCSGVEAFDWIIESKKPNWMARANMPVVRDTLKIHVYDTSNKIVPQSQYSVSIKPHGSIVPWLKLLPATNIPTGCVNIKIEMNGVVAYDNVYNVGNLTVENTEFDIDKAVITMFGLNSLNFKLNETPLINIAADQNRYTLKVNTEHFKIPTLIQGSIGKWTQKRLHFQMESPFQGLALVDKDGKVINENAKLSLKNLNGLRLLSSPGKETIIVLKNKINSQVKISESIIPAFKPLVSYRDEIVRLFYLADAMDFENRVVIELKEGSQQKKFEIAGFTHTLEINEVGVKLNPDIPECPLELFAIPMHDRMTEVTVIPMQKENKYFKIPLHEDIRQWIIISAKCEGNQLMPRFVNTDPEYVSSEKDIRIRDYCNQLLLSDFDSDIWKQLLSLFTICSKNGYDIPFSTFDQFRALALSSKVAAKAYLYISVNQGEQETLLQKDIPEMEKDLGICFHWIAKDDWDSALNEICVFYKVERDDFYRYLALISGYMKENGFDEIFHSMMGSVLKFQSISHMRINDLRSRLGERVLKELPALRPKTTSNYNIPVDQHKQVRLLVKSPIAVAESIKKVSAEHTIWGEFAYGNIIRRNIQYSQFISPNFYKETILHVLNTN